MSFNINNTFDPHSADGKTEISENEILCFKLTHLEGSTLGVRTLTVWLHSLYFSHCDKNYSLGYLGVHMDS